MKSHVDVTYLTFASDTYVDAMLLDDDEAITIQYLLLDSRKENCIERVSRSSS